MAGVANFKTAVEAALVAATPPADGSGLVYRFIDTLIEERGDGKHRELVWSRPDRIRVADLGRPFREFSLNCRLFISRLDRTEDAFQDALEEEIRVLADAYDGLTALGTSVLEGVLDDVELDVPDRTPGPRSGGVPRSVMARVTFPFRVLVGG